MTETVTKALGYASVKGSGVTTAQPEVSKLLGYSLTTTLTPQPYVPKLLGYALIDLKMPNRHNSVYVHITARPLT